MLLLQTNQGLVNLAKRCTKLKMFDIGECVTNRIDTGCKRLGQKFISDVIKVMFHSKNLNISLTVYYAAKAEFLIHSEYLIPVL